MCIHGEVGGGWASGAEEAIPAAVPILDLSIADWDYEPEKNYRGAYPISGLCVSDGCSQYFSTFLSIKRFVL